MSMYDDDGNMDDWWEDYLFGEEEERITPQNFNGNYRRMSDKAEKERLE